MTVVSADALAEAKSLLLSGRTTAALAAFRALVDIHPQAPNLRYWLGSALAANGDAAAATDAWSTARIFHSLALMRDLGVDMERIAIDAAYAAEVGRQLMMQGLPGVAASALAKAAESGDDAGALADYGLSMAGLGHLPEAFEALRSADTVSPHPQIHASLVNLHVFNRDHGVGRSAEAAAWAEIYTAPAARPAAAAAGGRPLRVGYLATSFSSDSLQRFALPAIANHDQSIVHPMLYLADGRGAPQDEQIRRLDGLDAVAAAEVIRADQLDILVDLAGHSHGGRLDVFAHRPAPIQIAWSRDPYTTGLAAMDFVLQVDDLAGEAAHLFTETGLAIGPVAAPYRVPHGEGEPLATQTPALSKGYFTFAFFGPPAWLSDETVALWGRILTSRANTRLILKHGLFDDPVIQRQTAARFAAQGVASEHIDFRGPTEGDFHAGEFGDVDIGLLPAACVEPTPIMEMLSHGVPVLAVRSPDFQSRAACYPLRAIGLDALALNAEDDLVALAGMLIDDVPTLDSIRQKVMAAFLVSPYRDEVGFARRLEARYAQLVPTARPMSVIAA